MVNAEGREPRRRNMLQRWTSPPNGARRRWRWRNDSRRGRSCRPARTFATSAGLTTSKRPRPNRERAPSPESSSSWLRWTLTNCKDFWTRVRFPVRRGWDRSPRPSGRTEGPLAAEMSKIPGTNIKGTRCSLQDVLAVEARFFSPGRPRDVDEVCNRIRTMNDGLEDLLHPNPIGFVPSCGGTVLAAGNDGESRCDYRPETCLHIA